MVYNRKIKKEVKNSLNMDLAFTEFKVSIYEEIEKYLSDHKCVEGANLLDQLKRETSHYVDALKSDLIEIEKIGAEISIIVKSKKAEKQDVPRNFIVNNREICTGFINDKYTFIYSIGFDDHEKLYKYGVIEAYINGRKIIQLDSKIGFSQEADLGKYLDFKVYFKEAINELGAVKSIDELDLARNRINNELASVLNISASGLYDFLAMKCEMVEKITGTSGLEIYRSLKQSYNINRIRIILALNGYAVEDEKLIRAVDLEVSLRKSLTTLDTLDGDEEKDLIEMCNKSICQKSEEFDSLAKEIAISSDKIKEIVDTLFI